MYRNFREFLDYLEKNGKLLRVKKEVDTRFDIAAGIRKISDNNGPALLFQNVKGFPNWQVAGGVYATKSHIALALGLPQDADNMAIIRRYLEFDQNTIKPKIVTTGPVKEVVLKGDDVDLGKFPIPVYCEKDVGPYLTAGVEIAKDPEGDWQNASIHRRLILGKDRTTMLATRYQHLGQMIFAAEKKGQGLGIATAVGADPEITLASQVKAPWGVNEIDIASAIRGEPIEMVKCETIDATVPAQAEIVIEGVTIPGEKAACGPFAEFPGNYITMMGVGVDTPVVKVTAISMRKDAIFQALLTGMPTTENHTLRQWPTAVAACRLLEGMVDLQAFSLTPGGATYHAVVSIRKRHDTEPRNVILALISSRLLIRQVTVVDDDINVFDPNDVEWAVSTRLWPDRDIYVFPPVRKGFGGLTAAQAITARWGLDATMPFGEKEWYGKASVPGVEEVDYV